MFNNIYSFIISAALHLNGVADSAELNPNTHTEKGGVTFTNTPRSLQ